MTAQSGSNTRFFFDLSSRVKLRVSGADRVRFLNGQLTNDIRKASETASIEACVLNAKGKMDAHLFAHADGDSFLLDADPALQSFLQTRLEKYIIADDVQIEDVAERLSIFHVIGAGPAKLSVAARTVETDRFGQPGHDIWSDTADHARVAAELGREFEFFDENCTELFRIEQGIPRWGRELTNEIIPVEANLEKRCIDYEKGCYIGQETISRMKMSGQRNKQLCGLVSLSGSPIESGAKLFPIGAEKKEIGWITSATRSENLEKEIALAYVKRGFNSVGSKVEATCGEARTTPAEIIELPFISRRSI
jgi:folate-binding protein YgfZ